MDNELQVCSLELAQKLLSLGVNEDSIFCYLNIDGEGKYYLYHEYSMPESFEYEDDPIQAYTAAELGEMIPFAISKPDEVPFDNYRLIITKFISVDDKMNEMNNFIINYECDTMEGHKENPWLTRKLDTTIYDPNLANAMAKMLIYLIENNLIELKN